MRKILLIGLLIWHCFLSLIAVEDYQPIGVNPLFEPWRWKSFSELSDKSIRCLAEGKDQSMWFGTGKGLYYFDGLKWAHFKDENIVLTAPIYGLCYSHKGILYAVSPKGICHYNGGKWSTDFLFPEKNVLGNEWEILNFIETSTGEIWIGVYFGLINIKDNKIKLYTTKAQIKGFEGILKNVQIEDVSGVYKDVAEFIVFDLIEDQAGNLWIGLEDGRTLRLYNKNHNVKAPMNYRIYGNAEGMNISRLPILYQSVNGSIYAVSQSIGGAVNIFNPGTESWTNHALSADFGGDNINFSICETPDGTLWIGGLSRIFSFGKGVWNEYKQPALQVPPTRIIFKTTSNGSLWMVGHLSDVIKIDYQTPMWRTFNGLLYQCLTHDGYQWFIDAEGKIIRSNTDFSIWEKLTSEFPMSDPVRLFADNNNVLWAIGSNNGSAAIAYNINGSWTLKSFPDICWGFCSTGIFQARDKSIWIGASPDCGDASWGLVHYIPSIGAPDNDMAWKYYKGKDICEVVYALGETDNNSLLCGNFKGLFEYNGQTTRELHKILMEDIIKVEGMAQDLHKGVWIGTRSQGVIYYVNEKEWKQYTTEDGLASNSVSTVMVSSDSAVWVATDKGISRFDGKSWIKYALPEYFKIGRGNGSMMQAIDGSIWINNAPLEWYRRVFYKQKYSESNSPLVAYRIQPETSAPETEIDRFEKKVYYPGNTIIFWKGIDRWIETNENELQFSYKLDDKEWSDFSNEKSHSFLNMNRGKHIIQVRARDNFLNVDQTPAVIVFKVIPPIWGQVWFILLMAILLMSIVYLFLVSTRKNREMEEQNLAMKQKNQDLLNQQSEIEVKKEQIMKLLENERENQWFTEGVLRINEIIKKSKDNLETLGHELLVNLIKYLDLSSAGMMLYRKEAGDKKEEGYLELISAYGYNLERLGNKKMYPQEGLAGACLREKKTMVYDNVPDTYYVSSGLGQAKMTYLVLIPIKLHDEIIGIFEFSSFKVIEDKKIKLLEVISENVASNIISLDSKTKIELLYRNSQEQSARLVEQEEELRQQMEELQATQEESNRHEKDLLEKIEEYKKKIEDLQKEVNKLKSSNK